MGLSPAPAHSDAPLLASASRADTGEAVIEAPVKPGYRADIDGLRGIAVLLVVAFHAFPSFVQGGFVGVDVFFVISGFLISSQIFAAVRGGCFQFSDFYARRVRRIFPALITVLVSCLAAGWYVLLPGEIARLGKHIAAGAGFVSNIVLLRENGYFDAASESKPLLHLWSLGIEEQFYIVWPMAVWFAWRRRIPLLAMTIGAALMSFGLGIFILSRQPHTAFFSPTTRFWELLVGAVLAYGTVVQSPLLLQMTRRRRQLLSLVGAGLLFVAVLSLSEASTFPGWWALLPTIGTALMIAAGEASWVGRYILNRRLLIFVGLISFPLYLWHWPMLFFLRVVRGATAGAAERVAAVVASCLLAWLTYRFVERPLRSGTPSRIVHAGLGCLLFLLGGFGFQKYQEGGHFGRLYSADLRKVPDSAFEWNRFVRLNECFLLSPELKQHADTCVEKRRPLVALWGDSHAAALAPGFRTFQSQGLDFGFAQLTQAGCGPLFDLEVTKWRPDCNELNRGILELLKREQPDILVIHSAWLHFHYPMSIDELRMKFSATILMIKDVLPRTRIIVIGPVPRWFEAPQLEFYREQVLGRRLQGDVIRLPVQKPVELDLLLSEISANLNVQFISALDALCNADECVARVGPAPTDWIAFDAAHLTKAGAEYLLHRIQDRIFPGNRQQ